MESSGSRIGQGRLEELRTLYAPIREELDEVEEILRESCAATIRSSIGWSSTASGLGGKRLRPALVLLSAKACGELEAGAPVAGAPWSR